MTDCELLEQAAKAAGVDWFDEPAAKQGRGLHLKSGRFWNPLTDDGDALRLAVALGLVVDCSRPSAAPPFVRHDYSPSDCRDHAEATRRAIVRAAAEIGRSMNSDD